MTTRLLAVAALVLFPALARAAQLTTVAARTLDGDIRFDPPGKLTVAFPGRTPTTLSFDDLFAADFKASPPIPSRVLPRWTGRDIGEPRLQGAVRFAGSTVHVRGSGADMAGNMDQCYFVHQAMNGDGQIIARIASLQRSDKYAKAGIMIRANILPGSPYAMALLHAGESPTFQFRRNPSGSTRQQKVNEQTAPLWLKLVRQGNTFSAFCSADGRNWDPIGSDACQVPPQALVGVAVCSRNPAILCAATFERISITQTPARSTEPSFKGVVLRTGAMLAGDLQSAGPTGVRLYRPREQTLSIATPEVARLIFDKLTPDLHAKLSPGRRGALLKNGDFIEGDPSIADGKVRVGSVLFGLRRFELWQVAALALKDPSPSPGKYIIAAADGSLLFADALDTKDNLLAVDLPGAGIIRFAPGELREIRPGAGRLASLADLRPSATLPPKSLQVDPLTEEGSRALAGEPFDRCIALAPGATATWSLDGAYRLLKVRIGVHEANAPAAPVRFIFKADGKELHRSAPRSSLDDPILLTLNLSSIKTLEISVEPAGSAVHPSAADPAPFALLADPLLLRTEP